MPCDVRTRTVGLFSRKQLRPKKARAIFGWMPRPSRLLHTIMLLHIPRLARAHTNANANAKLHRPPPLALLARRHLASTAAPRSTPPLGLASQRSEACELGRATTPAAPIYQAKPTRAVTERAKKIVAYHQQYKCSGCAKLLPPNYEIDHIVPVALGGHNGLENLQALCRVCHVGKTRQQRHDILDAAAASARQPTPPAHRAYVHNASARCPPCARRVPSHRSASSCSSRRQW